MTGPKKFVAVTSCPTGIAHTYMAAESLEQSAKDAGHEMVVETQGAAGADPIPQEVIDQADAVIFAADVEVRGRDRFAGKPLIDVGVKKAISDGPGLIAQAAAAADEAPAHPAPGTAAGASKIAQTRANTQGASPATKIRMWLMTGVSYMIPFVAAGGLLIALSFMIGGYEIVNVPLTDVVNGFDVFSAQSWAALMFGIGGVAFGFLVPALAGYIAFAIADRPGIVPGFVGGALAVNAVVGAGFLGGIVAGFLGGFTALWISRWKVPKWMRGVMPVVIIPLLSTFVVGLAMLVVVGRPLAAAYTGLTNFLNGLTGANLVLLGVILGLMMCFDLGGPVNKVAYTFATTGLGAVAAGSTDAPQLRIMAAVMAAGMVPPLALALATTVRKRLFTESERENGRAAWLLGASFISEGAIPFAASDPLRVIPASMLGGAATGGLVMAFGDTLRAPHGGIWVSGLVGSGSGAVVGVLTYLLAIVIGVVISAAAVIALKSTGKSRVPVGGDVAEPAAVRAGQTAVSA